MKLCLRQWAVMVLLVFVISLKGSLAGAQIVTIDYPNFDNPAGLTLNGDANAPVLSGGQNVLRLTPSALSQSGSAFYTTPIPLTGPGGFLASFSTAFSFRIGNPGGIGDEDGQGADGLVFAIQTVSNTAGGAGGGIGYAGIPNSVGIEFDTYNNGGQDNNSGNNVGIDVNGSVSSLTQAFAPTGGSPNFPTRFNNGDPWFAWVDYNGVTQVLEVRYSDTNTRPTLPFLSATLDLPSILGTPDAFVGFTAGTGSGYNDQDILSWQFTNTFAPIGQEVPEPGVLAFLMGSGLTGSLFTLRRRLRR